MGKVQAITEDYHHHLRRTGTAPITSASGSTEYQNSIKESCNKNLLAIIVFKSAHHNFTRARPVPTIKTIALKLNETINTRTWVDVNFPTRETVSIFQTISRCNCFDRMLAFIIKQSISPRANASRIVSNAFASGFQNK
jgi:hypothetical protein